MADPLRVLTARNAAAVLNVEVVLSVAADQIAPAARTAVQDARAARTLAKARAVPGARIVALYPLAFAAVDLKQPVAAEPASRRFFDLAGRPGRFARDDPAGHASPANPLRSGPRAS